MVGTLPPSLSKLRRTSRFAYPATTDLILLIVRYKGETEIKPKWEGIDEAEPHERFGQDR
jgi:hypothetical protein